MAERVIKNVIRDRGSSYAVSGADVASRADVDAFIKKLKKNKKFAKATHHSWGVLLPGGPLKSDDGEAGAGAVILQLLQGAQVQNHVIVVTRWFGGKHLGGDRFRHVASAARIYLDALK